MTPIFPAIFDRYPQGQYTQSRYSRPTTSAAQTPQFGISLNPFSAIRSLLGGSKSAKTEDSLMLTSKGRDITVKKDYVGNLNTQGSVTVMPGVTVKGDITARYGVTLMGGAQVEGNVSVEKTSVSLYGTQRIEGEKPKGKNQPIPSTTKPSTRPTQVSGNVTAAKNITLSGNVKILGNITATDTVNKIALRDSLDTVITPSIQGTVTSADVNESEITESGKKAGSTNPATETTPGIADTTSAADLLQWFKDTSFLPSLDPNQITELLRRQPQTYIMPFQMNSAPDITRKTIQNFLTENPGPVKEIIRKYLAQFEPGSPKRQELEEALGEELMAIILSDAETEPAQQV